MPEAKNERNAYRCRLCEFLIVTINRDQGTTPFLIGCQAGSGCGGMMQSHFYRLPDGAPEPSYEWYRPDLKALRRLNRGDSAAAEHVLKGGLLLRKIAVEVTP